MIARTLTGRESSFSWRISVLCVAATLIIVAILALGLATGQRPATAAEGDDTTIDGVVSEDSAGTEPTPVATTASIESSLEPDPLATMPAIAEPSGDSPAGAFTTAIEPTPTETPVGEPVGIPDLIPTPTPTQVEPVSSDGTGNAVRAAESTLIEIGGCVSAMESDAPIDQGSAGTYGCVALITVAQVPAGFSEIVLDWGVVADVTPGWIVELRLPGDGGEESVGSWTPGAEPGLAVTQRLGASDDIDGDPTDDHFSYEVHFDVRLTAPRCGGPITPDVTLTPSVLPTIDGTEGWRRYGELSRQIRPSLAVAAPAPALHRVASGDLDDASNSLRFSHADQAVDAGTYKLTVNSGYCGGWSVSISATAFQSETAGTGFAPESLILTSAGSGPGAPPSVSVLTLGGAAQPVVSASHVPLPMGSYAYSFNLVLTIPGGTPPGTYTSVVTVTTSAAP